MFTVRCRGKDGELIRHLFSTALAEAEKPRAGTESILARLSELMFLHAVRQYIDSLPPGSTGWLAGLRDPHLRMALRKMHGHPAHAWTVESLASEVGMSRSAFAEHFTRYMDMPPMQYLSNWRLQLASQLLDQPGISIEQVAEQVGYESAAAFSRAFKRKVGMPPGAWRREHRAPGGKPDTG
jgi:transcriptional regulator GlxA family with amidase domain